MFADPNITALIRCPRCAGELERRRCAACGVEFPLVEGIPCLFPQPEAALAEWRHRLELLLLQLERETGRLRASLERPQLPVLTRTRLKLLAQAHQDHTRRLRALLAPLGIERSQTSYETHVALGTCLPATQGLSSYYVNLHRDWVWGAEENDRSFLLIAAALAELPVGRLLVLGAGGGRLVADLHQRCSPELTVAVDINPLMLIVASRVTRGEKVSLYEFPIAPRTLEEHALLRHLVTDRPVSERLHWVMADASHPPFAAGSFDTIVTPWLIDIIDEDFASFARRLNGLLRPGGRWINSGSLAFGREDPAERLSFEEVLQFTRNAGFELTHSSEERIPYMCSPASRHGRLESVLTFAATKHTDVEPVARHRSLPEWLTSGEGPVPLLDAFRLSAVSTRILAFVTSLIDGRRSLRDIAALLVKQGLMTAEDAEPVLREFLLRMYEDASRDRKF